MLCQRSIRFGFATLLSVALVLSILPATFVQGQPLSKKSPLPTPTPLPVGPLNDNFANATMIIGLPFSEVVDTTYATTEIGERTPSCVQWYPIDRTVWYAFTLAEDGVVAASSSAWFSNFLAVYTGNSLAELSEVGCRAWGERLFLRVAAGATYYFQVGGVYGEGGQLTFSVEQLTPPPNDDFANATVVNGLPFSDRVDVAAASLEMGEQIPSCVSGYPVDRTVWYAFTPVEGGSFSANNYDSWIEPFVAIYTGSVLGDLTEIGCRAWGGMLTLAMEAGTTYYFQVGAIWGGAGQLAFNLDVTPPPQAIFYYDPSDPSIFDNIWFWNYSYDPAGFEFESAQWDFGDGSTSTEWSTGHRYTADGDYMVQLTVTTRDGRTASISGLVRVRTHDVAITRFSVPGAASAGQTRSISVGVNSRLYPETVEVVLFKSVPGGYEWVGSLRQYVPVRPANRTTTFSFNYTFTSEDAQIGKVTFRAQANIIDARDALPADNEAIAPPTTVK